MIRSVKEQLWEIQLYSRLLLVKVPPSKRKIEIKGMTQAAKRVRQSSSVVTIGNERDQTQEEKSFSCNQVHI